MGKAFGQLQEELVNDDQRRQLADEYGELKDAIKSDPSPANRERLYRLYQKYLSAGDDGFNRRYNAPVFDDKVDDSEHRYVCTIFAGKPDPMGRLLLMDAKVNETVTRSGGCITTLAGSPKPFILGETHPDANEDCYGDYLRMHSTRPGGARIKYAGLGLPLYYATALGVLMYRDQPGVYSMDDGCGSGRYPDAANFWRSLVKSGAAEEDEVDGEPEEEEYEEDIEVCTQATTRTRGPSGRTEYHTGVDVESSRGDGAYYEGEVCQEQTISFMGQSEDRSGTVQYINTKDKVLQSGLVAFVCSGTPDGGSDQGPLPPWHQTTWNKASAPSDSITVESGWPYTESWSDEGGSLRPVLLDETVERLVRAAHGPSPRLALFIAEAIKTSKHPKAEDFTVAYLTRPDIAEIVRGNTRAMELLGQQRLPGLGSLSLAAHREVMTAMRFGQAIDLRSDNPFNLPKPSAALLRSWAKYGDL